MFVTLEGIDRSGKTTQAKLLAEVLGPETLLVREPGGTPAGERVRELLKDPALHLDPLAELMLFCAARAQLVSALIRPALRAGRHVVCDRFADSSVAYQGHARGLGAERVERVCDLATGALVPDLTVLVWLEPEEAFARNPAEPDAGATPARSPVVSGAGVAGAEDSGGSNVPDRFEGEGIALQRAVADGYRELASLDPLRIVTVDGSGSVEAVHERVMEPVRERLRAEPGSEAE